MRRLLFVTGLVLLYVVAAEESVAKKDGFLASGAAPEGSAVGVGSSLDVVPVTPKRIVGAGKVGSKDDPDHNITLVHSAKFLCGTIPHGTDPQLPLDDASPLVPGTYLTAINIHNPNPGTIDFTKKALETKPQGVKRGAIGQPVNETLIADGGLELDCTNIMQLIFGAEATFIPTQDLSKGFVVITTFNKQLDVVGVYTSKNVVIAPPPTCTPAACPAD